MKRFYRRASTLFGVIFVLLLLVPTSAPLAVTWQCGDMNGDGNVSEIDDLVYLVEYMYVQGPSPVPLDVADCDGNRMIDVADLVCYVEYMFGGGHPPYCPLPGEPAHEDISGPCLYSTHGSVARSDAAEYMYVEVVGDDIHIHHLNAPMNCCPGYCVEYRFEGNNIIATERDTLDQCDCVCLYNLESVLLDMPTGEYIITLLAELYGVDTVGIDTAVVSSRLVGFDATGCLAAKAAEDTMQIIYTYARDTLILDNLNVWFLCLARFDVDFERAGDTLRFFETNLDTSGPLCICPYNIHTVVAGIPPGTYTAEIYTRETFGGGPFELLDRRNVLLEN